MARNCLSGFLGVTATVTFLLCLETFPRLFQDMSGVREAAWLILRSFASLVPEYVGFALPLAIFLSSALLFRQLALAGELDALAASGIGTMRMLRVPLLIGGAGFLLLLGLRGFVQPAGERQLDSIARSVSHGEFGFSLEPRVANRLAADTHLYFNRTNDRSDLLFGVVIEQGAKSLAAETARLVLTGNGNLVLRLGKGQIIWRDRADGIHTMRFDKFHLAVPVRPPARPGGRQPARDRLDRIDLDQLLAFDKDRAGLTDKMARAAASGRLAGAGLCLVLPLFGLALGVPPKRSRSAVGLGAGIFGIVLFWRSAAFVEDRLTDLAPLGHLLLLAALIVLARQLLRYQEREGFGAVELALRDSLARARRRLPIDPLRLFVAAPRPADA
jgi:lipopolysaccharide export system permease protein